MSNGTTKQKGDRQGEFTEIGVFCGTFNPIHLGHLLIAECARDQFGLEKVFFVTSPRPPHRSTDLLDGEARHLMVSAAVADNPHFEASRLELERSGPSYTSETIRSLLRIYTDKEQEAAPPADKSVIDPTDIAKPVRLNLILGADNIAHISQWHDSAYLLKTCRFLVAPHQTKHTQHKEATVHECVGCVWCFGEMKQDERLDDQTREGSTANSREEPDVHLDLMQDLEVAHAGNAQIGTIVFPYVAISSSAIRQRLREGRSVLYMVPKAVNDLLCGKNFYGCKDNKVV